MGLFSSWRDRKDFDLARIRVPRLHGTGDIIIEDIQPMSPFLMEYEGTPTILIRIDEDPNSEVGEIARAVKDRHCLLAAGYKLYSTYPILIYSLFIYDSPTRPPLTLEGYRDVVSSDVQDFVVSLGRSGGEGYVHLYSGDPLDRLGRGKFTLRLPPFIAPVTFPHQTSRLDLKSFWLEFCVVAQQRARIPEGSLDFKAAVATHVARTAMIGPRSVHGSSGTINESDPDYPYK